MTKRDWLSVGLKIAGVCIVIVLFTGLLQYLFMLLQGDLSDTSNSVVFASLGGLLISSVLSLAMICRPDALAEKLAPGGAATDEDQSLACQRGAFTIALRIIGAAWLAFVAVARANTILVHWIGFSREGAEAWDRLRWLQILSDGVAFALVTTLGLYLLLGGKGLVRFAFHGTPDASHVAPDPVIIMGIGPQDVVFSLAMRVVGVLLFLRYLPALAAQAIYVFPAIAEWQGASPNWERILQYVVFVAVSIYLITGARHFVRWVFRPRRAEGETA